MVLDVSGVRLKLDGAHKNLKTIDRKAHAFIEGKFNLVATEETDGTDDWSVYHWADDTRQPDPILGIHLGEFAHNVRSALDQLLWLLVLHNGQTPDKHTQFPIFEREREWRHEVTERKPERGPACTEGVSPEAFEVIKGAQPYLYESQKRATHPLAQLQRISNVDKHQTLHVTSIGTLDGVSPFFDPPGYVEIVKIRQAVGARRFEAGAEICRTVDRWVNTPPEGTQMKVGLNGRAHVLFGNPQGETVIAFPELNGILEAVAVIVNGFEEFAS